MQPRPPRTRPAAAPVAVARGGPARRPRSTRRRASDPAADLYLFERLWDQAEPAARALEARPEA